MDYGNGMSPADFSALMGGNRSNYGANGDGACGMMGMWWMMIMFLYLLNQNGGLFGNNGNNSGVLPYMLATSSGNNTNNDVQRGFDQQSVMAGLGNLNNAVSSGFANAEVSRCNAQAKLLQTLGNNQMGLYQTLNQNQNANTAAMNQLAMNLQQCCCDNRQATSDLRFTIAQENCADRQAINTGVRDIIANQTANTQALINSQTQGFQAIQDKLCQLELDSYKQKVSDQAVEIASLRGAISQTAQTAQIIQDNNAQTANLIRAINPAPVPSYQVPNPYTGCCGNQGYYGCGCNG